MIDDIEFAIYINLPGINELANHNEQEIKIFPNPVNQSSVIS